MANENFDDLSVVRHVQTGDPVSSPVTSQPTRALELRLNRLEDAFQQFIQSDSTGKLVIRNVPAKNDVTTRRVVFFNASSGLFELALAGVTFTHDTFQLNPTALALGIVVAQNGLNVDVMIGGYDKWVDEAHKSAMLESTETFQPGVPYYLSAKEPGKVSQTPPALRVEVFTATDNHYVVRPDYSSPDAAEAIYRQPVGMRPVGSLRDIGPDFQNTVIVGFDALELYDPGVGLWGTTRSGVVATHRDFGYLVADASVDIQPDAPIYVRVEVATDGSVSALSALATEDLLAASGNKFNAVTLLALNSNKDTLREYTVQDQAGNALGSIKFKFTDNDHTLKRRVFFKFPDSFQGWKMIYAPIALIAQATVNSGKVTNVQVQESSVGYASAPTVLFTGGGGSGAAATAVLNDFGSVIAVTVTNQGSGYTSAPAVVFDSQLTGLKVLNGGSLAAVTLAQSGGIVNGTGTVANQGSDYFTPPTLEVLDASGTGHAAMGLTQVQNGKVVAALIVDGGTGYGSPVARLRPSGQRGYRRTKKGVFVVHLTGSAVSSVTVSDGGWNYPAGTKGRIKGTGTGATVTVNLDANGTVTSIGMGAGGTGYTGTPTMEIDAWDPEVVVLQNDGTTAADAVLNYSDMILDRVDVLCTGMAYDAGTTLTATGGLLGGGVAATLKPVLDADGRITDVIIVTPGSGYYTEPTFGVTDPGGNGHSLVLRAVTRTFVEKATINTGGAGFPGQPDIKVGTAVDEIIVRGGGSGYSAPPAVSIDLPASSAGVGCTATALLGRSISQIIITNPGSGYTTNGSAVVQKSDTTAVTPAVLKPLFLGGELVAIQIVDGGYGFTGDLDLIIAGSNGSGATAKALTDGVGAVAKIVISCHGARYTNTPKVTIAPPGSGVTAEATARLAGEGAILEPSISGAGGLRSSQSVVATVGNNLQVYDYGDDLNDSPSNLFARPQQGVFYYNIKADPALKSRYPASPVDRCLLNLNGTELNTGLFNEGTGLFSDPKCDLGVSRKTLFWTSFDQNGCPWDSSFRNYVLDLAESGENSLLPDTGPVDYEDGWWRLWENLFKYEPYVNRGWLHLNRSSRFYQSGKVSSLAALSPLRLIDLNSGSEFGDTGTPMTGPLLLTFDGQASFLAGEGLQTQMVNAGETTFIYINNTGHEVYISSILLHVVFQASLTGSAPAVENCAKITGGTQAGNYRNWIGTIDPMSDIQAGIDTKLYRQGQVKELFPDARDAYILLQPNEKFYIRVDSPAGGPITSQLVTTKIKAHVF